MILIKLRCDGVVGLINLNMFLLQILKNYKILNKNYLVDYFYLKELRNKIINQTFILKQLKLKKVNQKLKYFYLKKDKYKSKYLINIIIGVSIYKNNIIVYISDIKGKLLFFNTSGILKIATKKKKLDIIFKLLINLIKKKQFFKTDTYIALHLKNSNKKISSAIVKFLLNNLEYKNIQIVKIKNNKPHNGCRPKKIRRKKLGKLNFSNN